MSVQLCQWCDKPTKYQLCADCEAEDMAQAADWDDFPLSPEEEDAAELAYLNSRARAEWDHYHPGEPCPDIELPPPLSEPKEGR